MSARKTPKARRPDPAGPTFAGLPIVGFGPSAGGLAAFETFFSSLPIDTDTNMTGDEPRQKICALLRGQTGHDFSQYKQNTILRRVEQRMALHQHNPEDYLRFLQQTPAEVEALFRSLLIGVTRFFRDPEAFAALHTQVLPRLLADKPMGGNVRVWVPGCATGEEAYSIAILLQEHLESRQQPLQVQVFATDIDCQAIEQARTGLYPASIARDVSAQRLGRYFVQESPGGRFRVQKVIRDLLVFSTQNVIDDPPISRLDLISCRNLLIYLDGSLQKKLVPLFHYALRPGGFLFLGTCETVGEHAALFAANDLQWKIYQRREDGSAPRPSRGSVSIPLPSAGEGHPRTFREDGRDDRGLDLREVTAQSLLQPDSHSAVLIDARGEILYLFGRTGNYLEPAPGEAGVNILQMAREGLRQELTTALHQVVTRKALVRYPGLRVQTNSHCIRVDLTLRPATAAEGTAADLYLVMLEEVEEV